MRWPVCSPSRRRRRHPLLRELWRPGTAVGYLMTGKGRTQPQTRSKPQLMASSADGTARGPGIE